MRPVECTRASHITASGAAPRRPPPRESSRARVSSTAPATPVYQSTASSRVGSGSRGAATQAAAVRRVAGTRSRRVGATRKVMVLPTPILNSSRKRNNDCGYFQEQNSGSGPIRPALEVGLRPVRGAWTPYGLRRGRLRPACGHGRSFRQHRNGDGFTIVAGAKGTVTVTVTATDPGGLTARQSFAVTVPNRAPVNEDSIPDQTVEVGETATHDLAAYFSDPDGESLTYRAVAADTALVGVSV